MFLQFIKSSPGAKYGSAVQQYCLLWRCSTFVLFLFFIMYMLLGMASSAYSEDITSGGIARLSATSTQQANTTLLSSSFEKNSETDKEIQFTYKGADEIENPYPDIFTADEITGLKNDALASRTYLAKYIFTADDGTKKELNMFDHPNMPSTLDCYVAICQKKE